MTIKEKLEQAAKSRFNEYDSETNMLSEEILIDIDSILSIVREEMLKEIDERKLRILLNDLFQDIDTEARIDAVTSNAIVSVHLRKFIDFYSEILKRLEGKCEK